MDEGEGYCDLVLREGPARLVLRLADHGITLSEDGLAWEASGAPRRYGYDAVTRVGLTLGAIAEEGGLGQCRLDCADGTVLTVSSCKPSGYPGEAARNALYAAFVADLHARLAPRAGAVAFVAGSSEAARRMRAAVLVVAAAFFLGLAAVLRVVTEDIRILLVGVACLVLVLPLRRVMQASKPATYDPGAVPPALLP